LPEPSRQSGVLRAAVSTPRRRRLSWKAIACRRIDLPRELDNDRNNSMEPVEDKGRLYRFGAFTTIDEYLKWAAAHPNLAPGD
jgi:hypothetical protein